MENGNWELPFWVKQETRLRIVKCWNFQIYCQNFTTLILRTLYFYIITRKTWKGMNQTKMEGGTEWHLPKTDDWRRQIRRADEEHTVLFESFIITYFSFHFYVLRRSPAVSTTPIVCLRQMPLCPPFHFCLLQDDVITYESYMNIFCCNVYICIFKTLQAKLNTS